MGAGMALMAGVAGIVHTAAAAVAALILVALLCFIALEAISKSLSARGGKGRRAAGKKRGKKKGKRRGKKRVRGLLDCRHCHKRYTGPRHVCRLSWKQMQKVRKA